MIGKVEDLGFKEEIKPLNTHHVFGAPKILQNSKNFGAAKAEFLHAPKTTFSRATKL